MLVQGSFLVFLSYFLFSDSGKQLYPSIIVAGFTALVTGSSSVIGYFLAEKNENSPIELYAGLASVFAALFMLSGNSLAKGIVNWFFASYITINTIVLINLTWKLKNELDCWRFSVMVLLLTFGVLFLLLTGTALLDISISVLTGLQFFINGLFLVVLAIMIRKLKFEFRKTIKQIRE